MTWVIVATVLASGCGDSSNDSSGGAGGTTSNAGGTSSGASTSASGTGTGSGTASTGSAMASMLSDSQIADVAYTADVGEVQEAQAVLARLTDENVKGFANKMVSDYSAANQQLAQVLAHEHLSREPNDVSQMLASQTQAELSALAGASAAHVDEKYMDDQVQGQEDVLRLIDQALFPNAKNAALKQFLIQLRGTVQMDLQLGHQIADELPASK